MSTTIYSHALLRIYVIECQRSVKIAVSSLPPHRCEPAIRNHFILQFSSSAPPRILSICEGPPSPAALAASPDPV